MSSKSSNNLDLANLPYDPNLCAKRMWNDGWGCQCQKEATVDGMCSRHHKMMNDFGGLLPHGFYNEERPLFDLTAAQAPLEGPQGTKTISKTQDAGCRNPREA